jgi:hypothetical protein
MAGKVGHCEGHSFSQRVKSEALLLAVSVCQLVDAHADIDHCSGHNAEDAEVDNLVRAKQYGNIVEKRRNS